jgi:hypothetical protein
MCPGAIQRVAKCSQTRPGGKWKLVDRERMRPTPWHEQPRTFRLLGVGHVMNGCPESSKPSAAPDLYRRTTGGRPERQLALRSHQTLYTDSLPPACRFSACNGQAAVELPPSRHCKSALQIGHPPCVPTAPSSALPRGLRPSHPASAGFELGQSLLHRIAWGHFPLTSVRFSSGPLNDILGRACKNGCCLR